MNKLLVLSLSLILTASSSCKKGKADFTITGTITNTSINSGLDGATVKIYETPAGSGALELIGTATTNISGLYSFSFPRNQSESYTITCEKSNHFSIEETINFSDLSIKEDNVYNYSTSAKSWAKLRFVNVSPSGSDNLKFTKTAGKSGCIECCENTETSLVNIIDTTIYCINDGNTTYSYTYLHVGTSNFGDKSAITLPYDTTEIILNY